MHGVGVDVDYDMVFRVAQCVELVLQKFGIRRRKLEGREAVDGLRQTEVAVLQNVVVGQVCA